MMKVINVLKEFEEVDAITLGGSRAFGWSDDDSDYDLYVYLNRDLNTERRKSVLSQVCKHMDLGKTHWGVHWDDCILNDGTPLEINYFNINSTRQNLSGTLEKHIAWDAYTTCTCYMVFNSQILHDPKGLYSSMVADFTMPYPEQLRKNIISKNRELLSGITPSYLNQIEKAIKRNDEISINHRLASFAATYFDILFAINRKFQPGEKLLIKHASAMCEHLPKDFEENFNDLFSVNGSTISILHKILLNLDNLIAQSANPQRSEKA